MSNADRDIHSANHPFHQYLVNSTCPLCLTCFYDALYHIQQGSTPLICESSLLIHHGGHHDLFVVLSLAFLENVAC